MNQPTSKFQGDASPSQRVSSECDRPALVRRLTTSALLISLTLFSALLPVPAHSATFYVWQNSPSNGPGTSWASAFHEIQPAVDATQFVDWRATQMQTKKPPPPAETTSPSRV